jgi:hypothetical protein
MIDFAAVYDGLGVRDNMAGWQENLFLAPISWLSSLAPVDAYPNDSTFTGSQADLLASTQISGDHLFLPNKGFIKCYTTLDTAEVTSEMQKKRDHTGGMFTLKAFMPGTKKELIALLSNAQKTGWIVLTKEVDASPTDGYFQLGGVYGLTATIGSSFKGSKLTGDTKGFDVEIEAFMPRLIKYLGNVVLKP